MIDLADIYSVTFEVRNTAGTLTTPASNVCTLTLPDGTSATPALTVASVGVLRLDYPTAQAGRHSGWLVTANPDSAHTFSFDVDAAATGIVSLADAKAHLNVTSSTHDEEIRTMIDAATEWVEHRVGPVVRRSVTATVAPAGGQLFLEPPVISLTSLTSAYGYTETFDVATVYTDLGAGIVRYGYSGATFAYPVTVTYVAGRAIVPAAVRLATVMMLKAFWETQRGAVSLSVQGLDDTENLGDGMGLAVWRAEKLLEPYLLAPAVA